LEKINIPELSATIERELAMYSAKIQAEIEKAAKDAASKIKKDVAAAAPVRRGRSRGYSKGFTVTDESTFGVASFKVWNKRTPWLPHLLEYGHAIRVGGRSYGQTRAFPHMKPAEEAGIQEFEKKVEQIIEGGG